MCIRDSPFDHRASRFEEALTIIRGMLREGSADLSGRYYQVSNAELRPPGPRPAGPPIMMGGSGDRMLRLAARHADRWNCWLIFGDSRPSAAIPFLDRLNAACAEVGRNSTAIERSIAIQAVPSNAATRFRSRFNSQAERIVSRLAKLNVTALSGSPEELACDLRVFAALGVSEVQVRLRPNSLAGIEAARQTENLLANSLLPQAELTFQAALAGYETGKVDFATLLDAQRQIRQARQNQIKVQAEAQMRLAEIERLLGEDL